MLQEYIHTYIILSGLLTPESCEEVHHLSSTLISLYVFDHEDGGTISNRYIPLVLIN